MGKYLAINYTEELTYLQPEKLDIDSGNLQFQLIFHAIVFFLGVPGNCLILRVYWTKTRKTSTHVLIMALAWADLAVCLLRFGDISERALLLVGESLPRAIYFIIPVEGVAGVSSFLVTAIIAADRYDCVCRPHRRVFTPRRGRIAAWAALLVSFITSIPSFVSAFTDFQEPTSVILVMAFQVISFTIALLVVGVCYGNIYASIRKHTRVGAAPRPTTRDEDGFNLDDKRLTLPAPRDTSQILKLGISVVDEAESAFPNQTNTICANSRESTIKISSLSLCQRPMLVVPRCTPTETDMHALNRDTHPQRNPRNGTGHAPPKVGAAVLQRKTTRMLFITSVVFLLTWLPYWIYIATEFAFYGGATLDSLFQSRLADVSLALYINNVVNPLIYGLANRQFRNDCRNELRKCKLC